MIGGLQTADTIYRVFRSLMAIVNIRIPQVILDQKVLMKMCPKMNSCRYIQSIFFDNQYRVQLNTQFVAYIGNILKKN